MRSPTVKVVTANVGNLKRDENIAKHPDTVEQIIEVAGYPELVLLQETNWTSGSFAVAQNYFSCMTLTKGKRYSLIGSISAPSAGESLGVGLLYSSDVSIIRSNTTFPSLFPELENRLLRADVLINHTDVLLSVLVVYAPVETHGKNSKSASFYTALDKYLEEVPCGHPIVACGDWNAVATVSDGAAQRAFSRSLQNFMSSWDLEDAYEILKERGSRINYTYTNKGRTNRRLDQLHLASELRGFVRSTKALLDRNGSNLTKSTHTAIQFNFRFGPLAAEQLRGLGVWRMPYWILTEEYREWLLVRVAMILASLEGLPQQLILVQLKAALKTVISEEARERAIRLSRMPVKERKQAALKATATGGLKFPSFESPEQTKSRVKTAQKEVEILALTKPDGSVVRGTEDLLNITADYYDGMLSTVPETNEEMEGDFLDLFPSEQRLDSLQQEVLDFEFSKEEVLDVIERASKKHSAPGPDGIPYKFYLICWELLGDLLTAVYNEPALGEPILEERNTSVIKLIFKSGNPADISNYRPIALMNTEVKIYTYLINQRLRPLLDDLIHPSQVGFVPGRLMSDNLDVVDHFMNRYSDKKGWMVGSLDFRKAYDTVSQDWVLKCLANVGVPAKMIQRVAAVQQSALTRVNVRGFLTRPIRILLGVRQGCPLSPALFIFAVDCLVRRLDQSMRGLVSHIKVPLWTECGNNGHEYPPSDDRAQGPTELLQDAKVLAYADDIIVLMSCNNDLQVVGQALVDFQRVSGLALSPSKTVLQRVSGIKIKLPLAGEIFGAGMIPERDPHGPQTPDFYDTSHLNMAFVTDFWPKDPVTGETPKLLPRDQIFRYLGIFFGGAKALKAKYLQVKQDLRDQLARMSLWGLPTYSKACLINVFFFSKVTFLAPYVAEIDVTFLGELTTMACDRINNRRLLANGKYSPRKDADERLMAHIDQGGFNLRDLKRFGESLGAVRAFRFFTRGSSALKDAAFQFYSDYSVEWSCMRLTNDAVISGDKWKRYLSPTMTRCLDSLCEANKPVLEELTHPTIPPEPTEGSNPFYVWDHSQAVERAEIAKTMRPQIKRFQAQRHLDPVRHLTDEELEHLEWGTGPRSQVELMALWRVPKLLEWKGFGPSLFARPAEWEAMGIFPESLDPLWSTIMGKMRRHYLKDAYKADTLHHLRTGQLPLYRGPVPAHYATIWKRPGCGICRNVSTAHLHTHVFCECPVMKAMLLKLGIPPVETLGEWVFGEEPLCRRKSKSKDEDKLEQDKQERRIRGNYYRELAHGIWQLERKLRQTGEDANRIEIQDKFSYLLKEAQTCFLKVQEYEASESSQSQETEAVALWLEESGLGGGSPAGTE